MTSHPPGVKALPQGIDHLAARAAACRSLDALRTLLADLPEPLLMLAGCAGFDPAEPTRRVLHESEAVSIVLFGSLPGQGTEPHDHAGSQCALRILRGIATEARHQLTPEGLAREVDRDRYLPGSVLTCDGGDVHALMNDRSARDPLVTLHVYRPAPQITTYPLAREDGS